MESKFYYFPNQTPENTKISNRAHALHITATAWGNITKHLDRRRLIQEAIDKEKAHRKALKDGSEAMTKQWPNSIENLRMKKERDHLEALEKEKTEKIERFNQLKQEQKAAHEEIIDRMNKRIFTSTGYAKKLTSALVLSETLHERDMQLAFNARIRRHDRDVDDAYAEKVRQDARDEVAEKSEAAGKEAAKQRRFADELRQQIEERAAERREQQERHVRKVESDLRKSQEEQRRLEEVHAMEKERVRQELLREQKQQIETERARRAMQAKEDEELDQAVELYANAKHRIDCMMKSKVKELRAEAVRKRDELVARVAAGASDLEEREHVRFLAEVADCEEKEKEKLEDKAAKKEQARLGRMQDREQRLKLIEEEKRIENEMKKWEMLNRIKTKDVIREHNLKIANDEWNKKLDYRKTLLAQMAEEAAVMKEDKRIEEIMSRIDHTPDDQKFFEYAEEVLHLARSRNRDTYAIEKVIDDYKREFRLVSKDRHCRCCRKGQNVFKVKN